ncbi:ABC transporter substrate-binding protein [Modestobacter excelsi]|uniref:ABC transporter substrate-binding protein n=1 Tax=Modestobacter excelsi TaxID=2213161 RepID=UPI00110D1E7D|nr:ABC transporter substrate-binding protein [Modestobacter excelsi]
MSLPTSPGRNTRRTAAAVTAAGLVLALAACGSDDADASSSGGAEDGHGELSLQLSWIKNAEFAGEYLADSNGYYTDAGFSAVNLVAGPSTGVAELVQGSVQVALSDAVSIGTAVANEDAPVKIIGTTYQKNPFTILSLADGGNIATPQDMVGKKIGVQDSNTSLFKALLAANGIDEGELTIVPVQYDPSVLVNGEVDGFVAYLTNESITVAAQGKPVTNLPFADNGLPFVAETFTATDQTIAEDREMLKDFLVAEIKGWTDAIADPAAAIDLALADYGSDLGLVEENEVQSAQVANDQLITSSDTDADGLFTISDELQQETLKSLAGAGIDVSADDLFDLSLLDEVYEEHPDLVDYAG